MTTPPLKGLQLRRKASDYTQADLAEKIGVKQSHYNKFEQGKVRLDVHRAAILANLFGCTIDELL